MLRGMKDVNFETSDFAIATTLCSLGYGLVYVDRTNPKRAVFQFSGDTRSITEDVERFFRGDLRLDPRVVISSSKFVKDRLYANETKL